MQNDLIKSGHDLDLRSDYIEFDAARGEKDIGVRIIILPLYSHKLLLKNDF